MNSSHPLRQSAFRRCYVASSLSSYGGSATFAALPLVAWEQTHSAQTMSLVLLLGAIGQLAMTLFGGVIADRYDRRLVLNGVDVGSLIALLGMAVAVTNGAWTTAAVVFIFHQAFTATGNATLPAMVSCLLAEDERVRGNSLVQGTSGVIRLAGPASGAALLALGGFWAVIAVDAATYVVSLALLVTLRDARLAAPPRAARTTSWMRSIARDLAVGFGVVRRDRFLAVSRIAAIVNGVANGMLLASIVPWLIGVRHAGQYAYAICCAMLGIGGIVSAFVVGHLGDRIAPQHLVRSGCVILSVGAALLVGIAPVGAVYAGHAVIGLGFSAVMIGYTTLMQQRVPSDVFGRVSSIGVLCFMVPYIGAVAVAGSLIDHVGATTTMSISAAAFCANSAIYFAATLFVTAPVPHEQPLAVEPELATSG